MFVKYVGLPNLPREQISAMSLAVGDHVMSADGEVYAMVQRRVAHHNQKVLEVRVGRACMRVTPNHRMTIPSNGTGNRETMAKDLDVGDFVMTAGGTGAEPITAIVPISELCTVSAITFEPDVLIMSQLTASALGNGLGTWHIAPGTQNLPRTDYSLPCGSV